MTRNDEIITELKNLNTPKEIINDILNAKNWSKKEKINFVNWACKKLNYLSSQADNTKKILNAIQETKLIYNLYLIVTNETN